MTGTVVVSKSVVVTVLAGKVTTEGASVTVTVVAGTTLVMTSGIVVVKTDVVNDVPAPWAGPVTGTVVVNKSVVVTVLAGRVTTEGPPAVTVTVAAGTTVVMISGMVVVKTEVAVPPGQRVQGAVRVISVVISVVLTVVEKTVLVI